MCFLNCQCKCGCTVAALILSALLGIIAAFLQITAVITVAPVFLFAVLAIALVYLGVLVLAAPGRRGAGCECLCGILTALLLRKTIFSGEPVPFVMELPNYRMPGAKNVALLLWDKAKDFLQRAFTVIFVATIAIWFLQTFDVHMRVVEDSHQSLLATISGVVAPIFAPLGFGDWRVVTSLVTGFMAKESVVSSLTLLYGSSEVLLASMTPVAAASLLVFSLLYTPCVAAVSAIKRELGGRWALAVVFGQCAIAWVAALIVRLIGILLGGV